MPTIVELDEAQARLKEIIARLGPDEEVVIRDHNQPVARLVGGRRAGRQPRQAGNCKGMITLLVEEEEHLKDFEEYMPSPGSGPEIVSDGYRNSGRTHTRSVS